MNKQMMIEYIKNNQEIRNKLIETIVNRSKLVINNNARENLKPFLDLYLSTTYLSSPMCNDLQLYDDIKWLINILFGEQVNKLPKRMREDLL